MPKLWYLPQTRRDAVDCIEHAVSVISFINESIAFTTTDEYTLSASGSAGLCDVLTVLEGVLADCNNRLLKEEHHG